MKKVLLPVFLAAICVISCNEQDMTEAYTNPASKNHLQCVSVYAEHFKGNLFSWYHSLNSKSLQQLHYTGIVAAKYKNLVHALADSYGNITVDAEFMGHHFMNRSLTNGIVDISAPLGLWVTNPMGVFYWANPLLHLN